MRTILFDNKLQMGAYIKKMRTNEKIASWLSFFDCRAGKYTLIYEYVQG